MSQAVDTKPASTEAEAERAASGVYYRPQVDIVEQEDKLLVIANMPGAKSDAIDIRYEDGTLTIHAGVPARHGDQAEYLLHEYGVGDFFRSFRLNEKVDSSKITAEYRNGVLTLVLPKVEAARPRRIPVATS